MGAIQVWSCDPTAAQYVTKADYILGPGGEQMSEYRMQPGGAMAWEHTNVWAAGRLLATYEQNSRIVNGTNVRDSLLHFYLTDPLGTRRAQADYAGNLEQTCASLPYGDGESCGTTPTEHLFTGKERDAESGNDYFGARYYASAMGRWMSPDWGVKVQPVPYAKLDDPQTLNLYSYIENAPLLRADPDGHCDWCQKVKNTIQGNGARTDAEVNAIKNHPLPATLDTPKAPSVPPPPPLTFKPASPALPRPDADSGLGKLMQCTNECMNPIALRVTSTSEETPVHPKGTPHAKGEAWDFQPGSGKSNSNLGMTCSAQCGAGFGLNEYAHPSVHATGGHDHAQTGPGLGGSRGDLPRVKNSEQ